MVSALEIFDRVPEIKELQINGADIVGKRGERETVKCGANVKENLLHSVIAFRKQNQITSLGN